jgi:hypothetical protein
VVAVDDVFGTRAALERVLGDPILAARLAAAGVERAREFDVPVMVRHYEELFLELARELAR